MVQRIGAGDTRAAAGRVQPTGERQAPSVKLRIHIGPDLPMRARDRRFAACVEVRGAGLDIETQHAPSLPFERECQLARQAKTMRRNDQPAGVSEPSTTIATDPASE
jgi:hypothetical protein